MGNKNLTCLTAKIVCLTFTITTIAAYSPAEGSASYLAPVRKTEQAMVHQNEEDHSDEDGGLISAKRVGVAARRKKPTFFERIKRHFLNKQSKFLTVNIDIMRLIWKKRVVNYSL